MNQLPLSNRPIQYGFIIIPFLSAFLMLTMGYQSLSAQSKVHEEGALLESSAFKLSPSAVKQSSSTPDSVNLQWHLTNIPQLELNNGSHDDLATNSSLRLGFQSQNLPAIETAITFDPPFTLTTAISDQQQAAIAYNPGDDNAVAVWWDTQSDAGDIYAAHFDQNGLLTSVPIRVNSVITGEQSQAAIAFSPTSDLYLVVWADKRAGGSWDIYGRLLDATGTPQGGELPIAVSNRARTAPDIVYDPSSDSFMVVWQQRTDGVTLNDIAAQLINSDGSLGNGFLLSNTGDQDYAPALATDGSGGFLAAWRRGPASGDSDLYGQRFTATGLVDGEIVISNAVGAQRRLDVAHHAGMANGADVYFIGWDDDRTATRQVYGQYVAGDGTLIAGNFRIDASPGANATYAAAAPMGEYIAVGWRQAGNLYLRLVEEDGSLGVPQLLSDAGKLQHQIAFAPSSTGLWAVWESSQDNGDGIDDDNIYAAQLWLSPQQAALTLADSVTVTQTMSDQLNVTLAANPTSGDYLMVFEDMQNGDADLAAQIVDGDGLPQNAPIAIHTVLTNTQQKAAAAYSPDADRYLIVWEDRANDAQRGDILGRLAAADGNLIGAPFVIADTNRALAAPEVAYDPPSGNFLVVWQQSNGATTKQDIMGQVVGSDGALGAPFIISGDGAQDFTPKLATDGQGEYLVVWRRGVADSGTEILYQKATMSGTVGVSHTVTVSPSLPGDMLRPVAAYNAAADNYLIVWEQNNAIYGQAVAADGLAEGNSIRLDNNSGSVPHWPQVTSIPDGFVAAWQHAGNLSVRHLAADGTPGMVYLLSDAIRAQRRPALASAGNTLLAAWESNEGANQAYDIFARSISIAGNASGWMTTTIAYDYDGLYRLTEANYSGAVIATYDYIYDQVGNMTAYTDTVGVTVTHVTRAFDPANRLITATQSAQTTSYNYDHNGNLLQIAPPSGGITSSYGYNQRNMLITVTQTVSNSTATVAEYRYDGDNARYQQIDYSSGITTTYHNDIIGLSQVLIADDGTTQTANLFGLDLIASDDGATTLTMLPDGLGSVRLEMQGGAVSSAATYEPYGTLLMRTGSSGTTYGYTGEQMDTATGLTYLRARYYAPHLKVFLSKDPFSGYISNSTSQNGYAYVHANPVNYADPTGLLIVSDSDGYYTCHGTLEDCEGVLSEGQPGFNGGPDYNPCASPQDCTYPSTYERAGHLILDREPGGIGLAVSGNLYSPFGGISAGCGLEYVFDDRVDEATVFLVLSFNVQAGYDDNIRQVMTDPNMERLPFSGNISAYASSLYNVDDVVEDYSGPVANDGVTIATGHGLIIGESTILGEAGIPRNHREGPYSTFVGYANGIALSRNIGNSYYIPLFTCNKNNCWVFLIF